MLAPLAEAHHHPTRRTAIPVEVAVHLLQRVAHDGHVVRGGAQPLQRTLVGPDVRGMNSTRGIEEVVQVPAVQEDALAEVNTKK